MSPHLWVSAHSLCACPHPPPLHRMGAGGGGWWWWRRVHGDCVIAGAAGPSWRTRASGTRWAAGKKALLHPLAPDAEMPTSPSVPPSLPGPAGPAGLPLQEHPPEGAGTASGTSSPAPRGGLVYPERPKTQPPTPGRGCLRTPGCPCSSLTCQVRRAGLGHTAFLLTPSPLLGVACSGPGGSWLQKALWEQEPSPSGLAGSSGLKDAVICLFVLVFFLALASWLSVSGAGVQVFWGIRWGDLPGPDPRPPGCRVPGHLPLGAPFA